MLKKLLQDYFSGGTEHAGDGFRRLKFTVVNTFTFIGVSFVFVIGTFNLFRRLYILGVLEIAGGIACIANVILLRRTKNIEFASFVILFLMLCLFVSLLVFGGDDKTGLFWFFTYPLLALFLKDGWRGFVWIALEILIIVVLTAMNELHFLIAIPHTVYEMVLLVLSLLAVTLIVFFYVLIKNEYLIVQKNRQDERLQRKILDDQFAIAERIQRLLIPGEDRVFGHLSVSGFYKAAAGVGGDYYDFFDIDGEHVAVIMCDVSGKSVSGAFVMVNIRSIFQQHIARANMNPAAMVRIINRKMLADSTSDIFAVLSVFMFNSPTRTLVFCNAGYGPFVYYSKKEGRVIEVPCNSLPVGVIGEESTYVNRVLQLEAGDIILSYTDGLLDSFAKQSEKNDKAALYRLVRERAADGSARIKQAIVDEIGPLIESRQQDDDISLVVSKVL
jgi:serine phosphatase RsbU (regulator of sigma subunit)